MRQTAEIREFLLRNISDKNVVAKAVEKFGLSRAGVYKSIRKLVADDLVTHNNARKGRCYELKQSVFVFEYQIKPELSESDVWIKDVEALVPDKKNIKNIWEYAFTEIFNNAKEHSGGTKISVYVFRDVLRTQIFIIDNGVGIFKNIKEKLNLENEQDAIFQLSKGKLTTNSTRHTGEGVFFTSRAVDKFMIDSYGLTFHHSLNADADILFDGYVKNEKWGTAVYMELANDSNRILLDVFDAFSGDDYGFDKTIVPIELARFGDENLVSRSQARRVLSRINLFKYVIFDFANVAQIGQAFADEIFRVFANEHPDIALVYSNASIEVENMIKRAKNSNI